MTKNVPIKEYKYGTVDSIEDSAIPRGASSRSLNWLSEGYKIALRRGFSVLGKTENTGTGRITGLGVALKPDNSEVVVRTRKRKIEYLDVDTNDWVEIGTDTLPADVVASDSLGEDISVQPYQNLQGFQVWLNSTNSGPYKIMTANMGNVLDMARSGYNYGGKIRIKNNRMFLWDRGGKTKDKVNLYASKLDYKDDGDYTAVTGEAISGSGTTRTGTLAFKGSDSAGKDFTVVAATDIFTSSAHGFLTGEIVRLSTSGTLPAGLSSSVSYYVSKIDTDTFYLYTDNKLTTKANATDTGTGTHTAKKYGTRRVCFDVVFTDGIETFTDNRDGTLTGSAGGTGTINYATGVFSLTFAASATTVTADYKWADDTAGGVADFTFSATRVATEGFFKPQSGGGEFKAIASFNLDEYCLHETKTFKLDISSDDLTINSVVFRDRVGIPNHRAYVETGDGIYYVDDTDQNNPHFRILTLQQGTAEVIPRSITRQFKISDVYVGINLADYRFDRAATIEFGDFIVIACRHKDSTTNNRVFVYNKVNKAVNMLDYSVSCFSIYNGSLIAGDDISDNVLVLFSGTDDNQSYIANYWESGSDNLGGIGTKRVPELVVEGEIGKEQAIKIEMAVDNGAFVEVRSPSDVANNKHAIEGDGAYVDKTQKVTVGSFTLGRGEIGGGGDGLEAYKYRRQFRIALDKFESVKFRFTAMRLGYVSITEFTYFDVRLKFSKLPNKYRVGR